MVTDSTEQAPVEKGSEEVEKNDAEEGVELFEEEDDDLNLMSSDDEMEQGKKNMESFEKIPFFKKVPFCIIDQNFHLCLLFCRYLIYRKGITSLF